MPKPKEKKLTILPVKYFCIRCEKVEISAKSHAKGAIKCFLICEPSGRSNKLPPKPRRKYESDY